MSITVHSIFDAEQIKSVEKQYNAKYICDSSLPARGGGHTNSAGAFFYQEEAHPEGSNYFALIWQGSLNDRHLVITDGISILDTVFEGIVADDGEIVYSRYRHDFVTSKDGSVSADGGQEYGRFLWTTGSKPNIVKIRVEGDKLVVFDEDASV